MAIWLKFKGYILAFGAGLTALFGVYLYGRSHGYSKAKTDAQKADNEQARKVEDAADRARRADGDNMPAVERLRRAKRIRDFSDGL
jgi:hypothetical protein